MRFLVNICTECPVGQPAQDNLKGTTGLTDKRTQPRSIVKE